jgi:undecaprenyl-diphosphatase
MSTLTLADTGIASDKLSLDQAILLWINTDLGRPALDPFFDLLSSETRFIFPLVLLLLVWLVYAYRLDGFKIWLLVLLVIAIGDFTGARLKDYFDDYRPCFDMYQQLRAIPGDTWPCGSHRTGMPSNHALNFFSVTFFLLLVTRGRRELYGLLLVAVLVGVSRVYLAKHYPSQVLVGMLVGMTIGSVIAIVCMHYLSFIENLVYRGGFLPSPTDQQNRADVTE